MAPPKQPSSLRRVSSSLSKVSTPPTAASSRVSKSSKPSKIVRLKLSKATLSRFPHDPLIRKPTEAKASPVKPSGPLSSSSTPPSTSTKSDPDTTENPKPSAKDIKEDNPAEVKTGVKRELGAGVGSDAQTKPKPTQRKRPRVGENGKIDGRTAAAKAMGYSAGAHKLGPKANQGAINEKLRALDRTSKPCRKWQKTGFTIKSFTGKVWELPTWRTPNARSFGADADSRNGSSNDLSKGNNSSSNIGSDKSPAVEPPHHVASSPVPVGPTAA